MEGGKKRKGIWGRRKGGDLKRKTGRVGGEGERGSEKKLEIGRDRG